LHFSQFKSDNYILIKPANAIIKRFDYNLKSN
jgi:hypothetical protein